MKARFKLYTIETHPSVPDTEPVVTTSPRSLGEPDLPLVNPAGSREMDVPSLELNTSPMPTLELPSAPTSPCSIPISPMERLNLETFNSLDALHDLPCLQRSQLPLDLYRTMASLVPVEEEQSYLFRYLYISRLPLRLRMFAEGLHSLPNELLAEICDYVWGFWADYDPAGTWTHHSGCRFARFDRTRRGGRAHGCRLPRRPPMSLGHIRSYPGEDPDWECWED